MEALDASHALKMLAEGIFMELPRWHDGAIWFSDIGGSSVHRIAQDGAAEIVASDIPGASGLGWTQSGDLLVASLITSNIYRVREGGQAEVFVGPEQHGSISTNDMATIGSRSYVTCAGRHFQMGDDEAALSQPCGTILLIDHETKSCRTVATGLKMPNGIAISPDGRQLTVAELYACRILRFDMHEDGSLSEAHVFAQLNHIADGICLDAEGGLWIGTGLAHFQRLDADGSPAGSVEVPGWSCVAPMLGGPDGRTLIMATNFMEKPDDIFNGKARGRIMTTAVTVPAAEPLPSLI